MLFIKNYSVTIFFQGDCRSYSYVVGISCGEDPPWEDLLFLAKLIPRVCHNINRVCYIAGPLVKDQILDITPTFLTSLVMSTIRQADYVATQVSFLPDTIILCNNLIN